MLVSYATLVLFEWNSRFHLKLDNSSFSKEIQFIVNFNDLVRSEMFKLLVLVF